MLGDLWAVDISENRDNANLLLIPNKSVELPPALPGGVLYIRKAPNGAVNFQEEAAAQLEAALMLCGNVLARVPPQAEARA